MTLALVTGATGFIGAHVVRALLREGVEVRALARRGSDDRSLRGLRIERVEGDLRDSAWLAEGLAGVDVLFHVGAVYDLTQRARSDLYAVNVAGTRALMKAALRAGIERIVHTSSAATIGPAAADGRPADERDWTDPRRMAGPYDESKYLSERLVLDMVERDGLPAVVVNPTAPIGPLDRRPTPTGRMIVDAARGRIPAYLRSSGLNIVHVRDVASGHVLAWRRGRPGQRYILGHPRGNLTLRDVLQRSAEAAGRSGPRFPLPYTVALAYAQIDERLLSRLLGRPPRAPIAGVRLARHRMWYRCEKAIDELGLLQSDLDEAFADAVEHFRQEGMIP